MLLLTWMSVDLLIADLSEKSWNARISIPVNNDDDGVGDDDDDDIEKLLGFFLLPLTELTTRRCRPCCQLTEYFLAWQQQPQRDKHSKYRVKKLAETKTGACWVAI